MKKTRSFINIFKTNLKLYYGMLLIIYFNHLFVVQSLLRNYMMNQWIVGNKPIDDGNISLSNITGKLTFDIDIEVGQAIMIINQIKTYNNYM